MHHGLAIKSNVAVPSPTLCVVGTEQGAPSLVLQQRFIDGYLSVTHCSDVPGPPGGVWSGAHMNAIHSLSPELSLN